MNQHARDMAQLVLKALSFVALVVGGIWTVYTYVHTREKDFYSTYWNHKLELFMQTSAAASTMATTDSPVEFKKAQTTFWELYYGQLSLVEGSVVKEAMEDFADLVPDEGDPLPSLPATDLQDPAYDLTVQLKGELGSAWRAPFCELQDSKPEARFFGWACARPSVASGPASSR